MDFLTIYHGSKDIIEKPLLEKGKAGNDYGQGFYCTESLTLAKEWACTESNGGYANQYRIDINGLKILKLSSPQYTILHWLALLVEYRSFRLSTPMMKRGVVWLKKNYLLDISEFDVIIGYRADDSYFSFARAFLSNTISLEQLSYAMRQGNLGEQFVLKSEKAFERIQFVAYEIAETSVYYTQRKKRDKDAREAYMKQLEQEDLTGVYIRDLIGETGKR